jgi:hypothetical protein
VKVFDSERTLIGVPAELISSFIAQTCNTEETRSWV